MLIKKSISSFIKLIKSIFFYFLFILTLNQVPTISSSSPIDNQDAIKHLLSLKIKTSTKISEIDKQISALLNSTTLFSVEQNSFKQFDLSLNQLMELKKELLLQLNIFDQFSHKIQNSFKKEDDLRLFLIHLSLEMAKKNSEGYTQIDPNTIRFLAFLSVALRSLPERGENVIDFIEGYIQYSSVSHPKAPHLYFAQRHYTNGVVSEAAHPISKDKVGDIIDERINSLSAISTNQKNKSNPLNLTTQ